MKFVNNFLQETNKNLMRYFEIMDIITFYKCNIFFNLKLTYLSHEVRSVLKRITTIFICIMQNFEFWAG